MVIRIYIFTLIIILLFIKIFYYSERFVSDTDIINREDPAYTTFPNFSYNCTDGNADCDEVVPNKTLEQCKEDCNTKKTKCYGFEMDNDKNCKIIKTQIITKKITTSSNKNIFMKKCKVGCTPEEENISNKLKETCDALKAGGKNKYVKVFRGKNRC